MNIPFHKNDPNDPGWIGLKRIEMSEIYRTILHSKTFTTLMVQARNSKTPVYRLHFSNCRFASMSLDDVFNQAYKYYDVKRNTVSLD